MNNPTALAQEISTVLVTERRGMIRHIAEATPYVDAKTYQLFRKVKHMADTSIAHEHRLTDLLQSLELDPAPVTFKQNVADHHFVTLVSVLPMLVDEKKRQIAAYQRAIAHLGDVPAARKELQSLLDDNLHDLEELQAGR